MNYSLEELRKLIKEVKNDFITQETKKTLLNEVDKDEWVGLSYQEVNDELKNMGIDPVHKWWLDHNYSHPARVKYREWYKSRNIDSQVIDSTEQQEPEAVPAETTGLEDYEPSYEGEYEDLKSKGWTDKEIKDAAKTDKLYPRMLRWSQLSNDLKRRALLNRKRFVGLRDAGGQVHRRFSLMPKEDILVHALRSDYYFGLSQAERSSVPNHQLGTDERVAANNYSKAKIIQQGHDRGTPIRWYVSAWHGFEQMNPLRYPEVQKVFKERGEPLCWRPGCDWPFEGTWDDVVWGGKPQRIYKNEPYDEYLDD